MNDELQQLILDVREQVLYLQELGVDSFDVTLSDIKNLGPVSSQVSKTNSAVEAVHSPLPVSVSKPKPDLPPSALSRTDGRSRLSSLPSLSRIASSAPVRPSVPAVQIPVITKMEEPLPLVADTSAPGLPEPTETILQIRAEIGPDCTRCPLHALGRQRVVNSVGNFDADLMFVGEAPGADEDEKGEPFVGRAGQLLTDIIKAMGFAREDVFIGNINRCRPPGNRAPLPEESSVCKPYLFREIAVVRPKVIVVLGATAAQNLLETKVPIGKLRGHFHDYLGTKVMPTFHPAYLLRDPHKKREVWEDMKMVKAYLQSII